MTTSEVLHLIEVICLFVIVILLVVLAKDTERTYKEEGISLSSGSGLMNTPISFEVIYKFDDMFFLSIIRCKKGVCTTGNTITIKKPNDWKDNEHTR